MRFIIAKLGVTCIGTRVLSADSFTNLPADDIPISVNFTEPTGACARVKIEGEYLVAYTHFEVSPERFEALIHGFPAMGVDYNAEDGTMKLARLAIVPTGDGVVKCIAEQLQSQRKHNNNMRSLKILSDLYSDIKYKYSIQSNYISSLREQLKTANELRKALIAELTAAKNGDTAINFKLDGVNPEELFVRRGLYDKRCKEMNYWKRKVEKLEAELAVLRQSDIS